MSFGNGQGLSLSCVGLSHHTTPLEIREALALSVEETAGAVRRLRDGRADEALVLSTCNRTEFYTRGGAGDPAQLVRDVVLSMKGVDLASLDGLLVVRRAPDSMRHLFRVACGLESMVLGEPQILGQVRDAAQIANEAGGAGLVLGKLTEIAFAVAKRARHETAIGEGPVSFASAGVELARKVFGSLDGRRALIVGAGDVARLAAEHIRSAGVAGIVIANRSAARGAALAADAGGLHVGLDRLAEHLVTADLVVTATSSHEPLIRSSDVRDALRQRGGRRIVFLDLSVPRNVEPSVNAMTNVFVHDVDALRTIVESNLDRRRREIPRVEALVDDAVERFLKWHNALSLAPTIAAFRDHIERIREAEHAKFHGRIHEEDRRAVEALTHAIVQKILHAPTSRLREGSENPLGPSRIEAIRYLFELDDESSSSRRAGETAGAGDSSGGAAEKGRDAARDAG
ncbi:MAG: glutamyl-tRNA reductase [bacterium]